jgi:hypothetical protein
MSTGDATGSAAEGGGYRSRYGIDKLREGNYPVWKWNCQALLEEHEVWDVVTGQIKRPNKVDEAEEPSKEDVKEWEKTDRKARRIIGFTVIDELQGPVREAESAKEAWDELEKLHAPNDRQRQFALARQLHSCKMSSITALKDHEREFSNIIEALRATGKAMDPMDVITQYLLSLAVEYEAFAQALSLKLEDTWTFNSVKGMVRVEAQRRANVITTDVTTSGNQSKPDPQAAKAHFAKGKNSVGRNSGGKKSKFTGKCYHCDVIGHMKHQCPKLVEERKREKQKSSDAFGGYASAFWASSNGDMYGAHASAFSAISSVDSVTWVLDTGASHFMHPNKSLFVDYRELKAPISVDGIAGNRAAVGAGLMPIIDDRGNIACLENTLHVPGLPSGLFSLNRALTDKNWETHITRQGTRVGNDDFSILAEIGSDGLSRYKSPTPSAAVATAGTDINRWHERFGHGSKDAIRKLAAHVQGLDIIELDSDADDALCEPCISGKHQRFPHHTTSTKATEPGGRIFCDLCGEIQEKSLGGGLYMVTFTDQLTKIRRIAILENKKAATIAGVFMEFKAWFETQSGHKIKVLRTDEGTEFAGEMTQLLKNCGIEHEVTAAYTSQSNGMAERANRTIMDMVRPMLHASGLPLSLWGEVAHTACYLKNRMLTRGLASGITPFEAFTGKEPKVGHLRIFGSACYMHVPKQLRKKLDMRSRKGYLVGFCSDGEYPMYRVWIPQTDRVVLARNVIINEQEMYSGRKGIDEPSLFDNIPVVKRGRPRKEVLIAPAAAPVPVPAIEEEIIVENPPPKDSISETPEISTPAATREPTPPVLVDRPQTPAREPSPEPLASPAPPAAASAPTSECAPPASATSRSRYGREHRAPDYYGGMAIAAHFVSAPRSYREAMSRPDRTKWEHAMEKELASIKDNDVWTLVPRPEDQKVVDSRWVLRIKDDGLYKARFCAKGFAQQWGVDYVDTFAPVAKYTSVRILFAIAAGLGLKVHQMDVVTAFLYGQLQDTVYVEQPEGYEVSGYEDWVYLLKRALYGLKQAPLVWYDNIKAVLQGFEFVRCESDHGIFVTIRNGYRIYLAVYVDDLLVMGQREEDIEEVKDLLKNRYQMKDLGIARRFLGMDIDYTEDGSIKLHLKQYLSVLLERHGMLDCNPVSTPMDSSMRLIPAADGDGFADVKEYQQIVGELQFASLVARPDISCAVGTLSQFNIKPTSLHLAAAKRVLRYLKGTADWGIVYSPPPGEASAFSDADWAGDRETRKSRTGYVVMMNKGAVSWRSSLQPTVALSTTEAEYMALTEVTKEVEWVRTFLKELQYGTDTPTTVSTDNQGAKALANNPVSHSRTKHIAIRHHFIREKVADNTVWIQYVPTEMMTADSLTKTLARQKHVKCSQLMGMA